MIDACDPDADLSTLRKLIKLNTGENIKLTKDEICQVYKNIQDEKYRDYDFSGASIFLQCLKIKKNIINRKLLDAFKEIFKKPLSLRKLKFIRYIFLPASRLSKT